MKDAASHTETLIAPSGIEEEKSTCISSLFSFYQLSVWVTPSLKSVCVCLDTLGRQELHQTLLLEIESFLEWAMAHPEIKTLVFRKQFPNKSLEFCQESALEFEGEYFATLRRLFYTLLSLEQMVLMDLGTHNANYGLEFFLTGDILFIPSNGSYSLNFFEKGLVPLLSPLYSTLGPLLEKEEIRATTLKKIFNSLTFYNTKNGPTQTELYGDLLPWIRKWNSLSHLSFLGYKKMKRLAQKNFLDKAMASFQDFQEWINPPFSFRSLKQYYLDKSSSQNKAPKS